MLATTGRIWNGGTMWIDLAIAMSCGGAGLICGWVMHGMGGDGRNQKGSKGPGTRRRTPSQAPNREQITEVAQRLQSYALSMAADVDAHQSRVQEVNNSLSDRGEASHEDVVRAVTELIDANEEMQSQLKEAQDRIHEQTIQIESAEKRAQTDALTRVPNRGAFDQHIAERVNRFGAKAGALALLDVDHFKQFNDVYGHRAGDEVLKIVANILHSRLQAYGLVARFGGEEFAIVLDGFSVANARSLVERARLAIGDRDMMFEGKRLRVSASLGVAEYVEGQSLEDWLQRTDEALYRSKSSGRDCGHWMDGGAAVRIDIGRRSSAGLKEFADGTDADGHGNALGGISKHADCPPAANALADLLRDGLPPIAEVAALFDELLQRAGDRLCVHVMAVRCFEGQSDNIMTSMVQVARSTMRGVDRIGIVDDATFAIGLPSVDPELAIQQARQICRAAEAIGLSWDERESRPFCIGLAQPREGESFASAVSRATQLAAQGADSFSEPVWVEQAEPTHAS